MIFISLWSRKRARGAQTLTVWECISVVWLLRREMKTTANRSNDSFELSYLRTTSNHPRKYNQWATRRTRCLSTILPNQSPYPPSIWIPRTIVARILLPAASLPVELRRRTSFYNCYHAYLFIVVRCPLGFFYFVSFTP
jgi:hypothetical protein